MKTETKELIMEILKPRREELERTIQGANKALSIVNAAIEDIEKEEAPPCED